MRKLMFRGLLGPCLLALLLVGSARAAAPERAVPRTKSLDTATHIDVNSIDMFVTNVGSIGHDMSTGDPGMIYPAGTTKSPIFAAGLWVGARVEGETRVSVAEYSMTYLPGPLLADGTPANPDELSYRVYRIPSRLAEDGSADSTDYHEWPAIDGAPVDGQGNPKQLGDQMLWSVYNDIAGDSRVNDAASVNPLGIEVQQTAFAFDRKDPLGNVVFLVYKIKNKGGNTLENTYISLWSDPDLGGAGDDLVGCDTTLSLGYCYNATNIDNIYGLTPPAVGFDFLQGPIVPSAGDTAHVSGVAVPGYRNLPMTSFAKYINGTDPGTPVDAYNYMQSTTYSGTGDPVVGAGDLDVNPADRRMMLSSGPFTMAPGDSQEVVAAILVGQGRDRLTSITALKYNDRFAQIAFDRNFQLPPAPSRPVVEVVPTDNAITLYWDTDSETGAGLDPGYAFEGYNVYMGESVAGPWTLIYTFDVVNGERLIYDEAFDINTGVPVTQPVQFGSDSSPQREVTITQDFVRGGTLRNGRPYYFGVTAYAFNGRADVKPGLRTVENSIQALQGIPDVGTAGTRYEDGAPQEMLGVESLDGFGDVVVEPILVDPTGTVPADYEVSIGYDASGPFWTLKRGSEPVLEEQRNFSGNADYLVRDGVLWRVTSGPGLRTNGAGGPMIDEIKGDGGAVVPADDNGGPGNYVWHDSNSTDSWSVGAGGGNGGVGRLLRDGGDNINIGTINNWDIVIKWDYDLAHNWGWWAFDSGQVGPMPWGAYLRDPISGEERRLLVELTSAREVEDGAYDLAVDGEVTDPVSDQPATDWAYLFTLRAGTTYEEFLEDVQADSSVTGNPGGVELMARLIFAAPDSTKLPKPGTEIQFSTTKPLTPQTADRFAVTTSGVSFDGATAKSDLALIRVVPNPYFAHSVYELNQFEHVVKFTRMPPLGTVRIFTIAGDLIRTLEKTDPNSSFVEWDLLTERRLPVASGVYIYQVEGKDRSGQQIGSIVGRLAVFVEKERLNTF